MVNQDIQETTEAFLRPKSVSQSVKELLETKQGKTYTVFFVTVLTVIVMFFLAIRPAWVSITNKLTENKLKREYIAQANQKLTDLVALDATYFKYLDSIEYLNVFMADEQNDSFTVENVFALGKKNNVTVSSVQFTKPDYPELGYFFSTPDVIAVVNININASGDLQQLELFAKDVEDFGKTIDIKQVRYGSRQEGNNRVGWYMTISGQYYLYDINNLKLPFSNV